MQPYLEPEFTDLIAKIAEHKIDASNPGHSVALVREQLINEAEVYLMKVQEEFGPKSIEAEGVRREINHVRNVR